MWLSLCRFISQRVLASNELWMSGIVEFAHFHFRECVEHDHCHPADVLANVVYDAALCCVWQSIRVQASLIQCCRWCSFLGFHCWNICLQVTKLKCNCIVQLQIEILVWMWYRKQRMGFMEMKWLVVLSLLYSSFIKFEKWYASVWVMLERDWKHLCE